MSKQEDENETMFHRDLWEKSSDFHAGHNGLTDVVRNQSPSHEEACLNTVDEMAAFIEEQRRLLEECQRQRQASCDDDRSNTKAEKFYSCCFEKQDDSFDASDEEVLHSGGISSLELIQEQQRILDEIERNQQVSSSKSKQSSHLKSSATTPCDTKASGIGAINKVPADKHTELEDLSSAAYAKAQGGNLDRVLELSTGRKLKIKGTNFTLKAIEAGAAVQAYCFNCRSEMKVSSTAQAVYCSLCHQITPIELATIRCKQPPNEVDTCNIALSSKINGTTRLSRKASISNPAA